MYAHLANELVKTHIVDVLLQPNQLKKIVHLGERKRVGKKMERKEEGEEKGGGGKREGRKKKREKGGSKSIITMTAKCFRVLIFHDLGTLVPQAKDSGCTSVGPCRLISRGTPALSSICSIVC